MTLMPLSPRSEAERLLRESGGLHPGDEATQVFNTAAIAFALLAVAEELGELREVIAAPINSYNDAVRIERINQ